MAKFDKDRDSKLSPEEQAAMEARSKLSQGKGKGAGRERKGEGKGEVRKERILIHQYFLLQSEPVFRVRFFIF